MIEDRKNLAISACYSMNIGTEKNASTSNEPLNNVKRTWQIQTGENIALSEMMPCYAKKKQRTQKSRKAIFHFFGKESEEKKRFFRSRYIST